tara:strand:+ start:55 stop:444 length:390 start_codon:yes stop_codon:yes gene_type:complete
MYTYDETIFSDLYKDAYGFRPRGHNFYTATPAEKQEIWDATILDMEAAQQAEIAREKECEKKFKDQISKVIEAGAGNRINALRWMTSTDTFYSQQCVEHFVWSQGILFTDYGRALSKELMEIVEFEEAA